MRATFNDFMFRMKESVTAICGIFIAFITPIIPLMLIVGCAIALDTFMGIYRSHKLGESITSKKMSSIVSKFVLYQSSVVLMFAIERFILNDFTIMVTSIPLVLTKIVATTLLFIEGQSVIENYAAISGVNVWSKFKEMLSRGKDLNTDLHNFGSEGDQKQSEK